MTIRLKLNHKMNKIFNFSWFASSRFFLIIICVFSFGFAHAQGVITVTSPTAGSDWLSGNAGSVKWTSSNVAASTVRILLSTNGGVSYPMVLLASAPNSGSANVGIPNIPTAQARVRVEAIGQVAFGNSVGNFTIQSSLGVVAKPIISPGSGTVLSGTNFIITCETEGATIYFTTNGNTPVPGTTFTQIYAGPFGANANVTVKAIGVKAGYNTSGVTVSIVNVIGNPPLAATPVITPSTGNYTQPQSVSISCATPNSTIYYTTSGNVPVIGATFTKVYTGPFSVNESATVRAIAVANGFDRSAVAVAYFTLPGLSKVGTPMISAGTGTHNGPLPITITTSTPGATIYYTTSGNEPVPGTSFTRIYTGSFIQSASGTIRAMAQKAGMIQSATAVSFLTILTPNIVATPVISLASGSYSGPQTVTLFCNTAGATIYYTTSGNTPVIGTGFTRVYTGPINVTQSTTIRAMAVKNGLTNSSVAVSFLTITGNGGRMAVSSDENEENLNPLRWSIGPNPTTGPITISFSEVLQVRSDVVILNALGSEVRRFTLNGGLQQGQYQIHDLKSGIYYIRIENTDYSQIERIIKN